MGMLVVITVFMISISLGATREGWVDTSPWTNVWRGWTSIILGYNFWPTHPTAYQGNRLNNVPCVTYHCNYIIWYPFAESEEL